MLNRLMMGGSGDIGSTYVLGIAQGSERDADYFYTKLGYSSIAGSITPNTFCDAIIIECGTLFVMKMDLTENFKLFQIILDSKVSEKIVITIDSIDYELNYDTATTATYQLTNTDESDAIQSYFLQNKDQEVEVVIRKA